MSYVPVNTRTTIKQPVNVPSTVLIIHGILSLFECCTRPSNLFGFISIVVILKSSETDSMNSNKPQNIYHLQILVNIPSYMEDGMYMAANVTIIRKHNDFIKHW